MADGSQPASHNSAAEESHFTTSLKNPRIFWEFSGDLFSVCDGEGRFIEVNPAWTRLLGWERDALVGRLVTDFMHPEDLDSAAATAALALDGEGRIEQEESRYRCADGTYRWLIWSAYTDGDLWCWVGKDITERRQAEWALRENQTQLAAIIEHTTAAIYIKSSEDFRYLMMNPQAEKLLGLEPGAGIGLRDEDVHHPDTVSALRKNDRKVIDERSEISGEEQVMVRGELLTYLTLKFPLPDEHGTPYALCGMSTDITARKREEAELREHLEWETRIRTAIQDDRLLVFSQPIVDLVSGELAQEELLVRMRGPEGTEDLIPPCDFLPQAERFGLVGQIDRFMVRRGISIAAQGRAVNINLSGRSIGDQGLTREIERLIQSTGADPRLLVFEITETAAIDDLDVAREFCARIQEMGCRCALDDFGTGFGSLTYQRHLVVQFLKIDISFVRGMVTSPADRQVVKSVVGLARDFGQQTIAEGVEDEATLTLLQEFGVDYAQGFHIGRPQLLEEELVPVP